MIKKVALKSLKIEKNKIDEYCPPFLSGPIILLITWTRLVQTYTAYLTQGTHHCPVKYLPLITVTKHYAMSDLYTLSSWNIN